MDIKGIVTWLLGLDIVKGAGTYVIGGVLILGGFIGTTLGLVDPITGGGWMVAGYGLIRARFPVTDLQAKLDELSEPR